MNKLGLVTGVVIGVMLGGATVWGFDNWAEQQGYRAQQEQRDFEMLNNQRQQMMDQQLEKSSQHRSPC